MRVDGYPILADDDSSDEQQHDRPYSKKESKNIATIAVNISNLQYFHFLFSSPPGMPSLCL